MAQSSLAQHAPAIASKPARPRAAQFHDELDDLVLPRPSAGPVAPSPVAAPGAAMFAITLLLSSTLLFLVQPMFAKMVLPRLGGTPAVWNTCMVFFQACLLGGYAYAHFVTRRLRAPHQLIVHAVVLSLPLLVLPVALPAGWNPPGDANPIPWLLMLLAASVGLPFFVVSTTAPLVQSWFAKTGHRDAGDPYFLYAASNVGSMVALLGYPIVVEPVLRLGDQSTVWAWGYGAFAVLVLACGVRSMRAASASAKTAAAGEPHSAREGAVPEINWATRLRWIALAAVPSSYLLGVTTFITSDVAAVPLLWVLPLALYLLTFILVFARRPLLSHKLMVYALPTAVLAPVLFLITGAALPAWAGVAVHLLAFFVATMVCHGELARTRPLAGRLTEFYLMMSLGGVIGGAFNALLAPILFSRGLEYPLAIVLACLLAPPRSLFSAAPTPDVPRPRDRWLDLALPLLAGGIAWAVLAATVHYKLRFGTTAWIMAVPVLMCVWFAERRARFALGAAALLFVASFFPPDGSRLLEIRRSFFGVHRIVRTTDGRFNELFHGTTLHGRQRVDADARPAAADEPLSYYHRRGPIGSIFAAVPPRQRRRVSVIGLGVGSTAAYADAGDRYTYYEIDPLVRWTADASGHFNFLPAARARGAATEIVMGDARLTLASAPAASVDLLIVDAFSGDAIPLHLLTREALAMYLDKVADTGLLAVHISNLYLDLEPVLASLAADARCVAMVKQDGAVTPAEFRDGKLASIWVLIARDHKTIEWAPAAGWKPARTKKSSAVWTDDFSNILTTLK